LGTDGNVLITVTLHELGQKEVFGRGLQSNGERGSDGMRKKVKTKKELLAEIAELEERLERATMTAQDVSKNRIGRKHAEQAFKKSESARKKAVNGQKRAKNELKVSELRVSDLTSQLLLAEERERKRIANELHDSLGQSLRAISTSVRNALHQVDEKVKTGSESLAAIVPIIEQSISEVGRIAMNLRPSILDDLGLLPAIEWFIREYQTTYPSIRVEKQMEIDETSVPDHLKAVIYRILQESMNNIAKHSKASLVSLSLKEKGHSMELRIEDNGIGFDLESIKKGLGIGSMTERAEFSGGSFEIESISGEGTIIRASWSLILNSA
jgi:signal transduction histidine kinase